MRGSLMSTKLSWGIIGTGMIAKKFAAGVAHSKTGKVVAVGSRTQESADKFGDEFDVPNRWSSYDALLADESVDAVYISTPHPMHAEWAIKAAEAKKHILCEKPIAINRGDAAAIIDAARRNDVFLMEAFMYRCHPQTKKVVDLIKEKAIGDVRVIEATFAFCAMVPPDHRLVCNDLGGGGILDVGCYPISMSRLVAGAALGQEFADPIEINAYAQLHEETGVDVYSVATMKFPGNILAKVGTGVHLNLDNDVRIFGTEGKIVVPSPWIVLPEGGTSKIIVEKYGQPAEEVLIETDEWLYGIEADTVAENIEARQAPSPAMNWADTLGNITTLDRWRESIGVTYNMEKPENLLEPVHKGQLAVRNGSKMKYGEIEGVDKPVSRFVFGVDKVESSTLTGELR